RSFRLDAPLARVLPLFTAEGERSWAPGWEPTILSGDVERGSAFATRGHSGIETTWIVADYRPAEGRVSYARLAQGSNIGLVDVTCTAAEGGGTHRSSPQKKCTRSKGTDLAGALLANAVKNFF